MKLTDLTKKIASLRKAAEKRLQEPGDVALQNWLQGYVQGLEAVSEIVKREHEIEKAEQKLARLKTEGAQEPEPDLSQAPTGSANDADTPATTNGENRSFLRSFGTQEAA